MPPWSMPPVSILPPPVWAVTSWATATTGSFTQSGILDVNGNATFRVDAANSDADLDNAANDFDGNVSFTVGGVGTYRDITLRNVNASAAYPTMPASLRNLTLIHDNDTITLEAMTLTGNLDVTAGGNISDSGLLTVAGTASFTTSNTDDDINLDTWR